MLASELELYIASELETESLAKLDYHYIEIGTLLLIHARDDIESPDKVSALFQDLQNVRIDKLKSGLLQIGRNSFDGELILRVPIPNMSAIEIDTVRGVMCESLNVMLDLSGNQRLAVSAGRRIRDNDGYEENTRAKPAAGRRFRR